jgi:hypothetical protein
MKKIALAVAVLIFSTGAFAGCTKADLVGTWVSYSLGGYGGGGVNYCNFTVLKDGSLKVGSSCDSQMMAMGIGMGGGSEPITGKLTIDAECHVKGSVSQITSGGSPSPDGFFVDEIDAYLSKGKDSVTGTKSTVSTSSPNGKGLFVATKTK